MTPSEITSRIDCLNCSLNDTVVRLKGVISEQERLKQVEQQLKAEKELKRQEAERVKQEEDIRKRKQDLEHKFMEENNNRTQEEASQRSKASGSQATKKVMVSQEIQTDIQQEILDHDLASRIARESNRSLSPNQGCVDNSKDQVSPVMLPRYLIQSQPSGLPSKFEHLTKWKYSELRDTINTSCDIELLEACKAEFHRRLKVYHEWKSRNQMNGEVLTGRGNGVNAVMNGTSTNGAVYRAPACIMDNAGINGSSTTNPFISSSSNEDRFFRIPFVRPSVILSHGQQKGLWFAHFQGQWISRQMELHPEKTPILLVAGMLVEP